MFEKIDPDGTSSDACEVKNIIIGKIGATLHPCCSLNLTSLWPDKEKDVIINCGIQLIEELEQLNCRTFLFTQILDVEKGGHQVLLSIPLRDPSGSIEQIGKFITYLHLKGLVHSDPEESLKMLQEAFGQHLPGGGGRLELHIEHWREEVAAVIQQSSIIENFPPPASPAAGKADKPRQSKI